MTTRPLQYQTGFGNEFASEALPGILAPGRNNPQAVRYGLYAEQLSGTAFTAPRAENRRTWLYRIQPSVMHGAYVRMTHPSLHTAPFDCGDADPRALRWSPMPIPESPHDFIDGLFTVGGNGNAGNQAGMAVHIYTANRSMHDRAFADADGELLIVPQTGRLRIRTELGVLEIEPQEFLLIPRGLRFSVALLDPEARGYICENYGALFRLPELGPIGANGLANPRDFLVPVADYEDRRGPCRIVTKYQGQLWQCETGYSPFDVVAWHGDLAPCKFDLRHFVTYGSISVDSPDPSVSTVLTSPSSMPGVANVDFVAFAPRWQVAEGTFRPPYFHRNFMSEFMGSITGIYEGKADGFVPGGASLHNCMTPHGPDAQIFQAASTSSLQPHKLEGTMAFMFESRYPIQPTPLALDANWLQPNYADCWKGFERRFRAPDVA